MSMYVDISINEENIHRLRATRISGGNAPHDMNKYRVSILEDTSFKEIGIIEHCYGDLAFKLTQKMCELAHEHLYSNGVAIMMTKEQSKNKFRQICAKMGMTAEEFIEKYDAGEYNGIDIDSVPGLLDAIMAIPLWKG